MKSSNYICLIACFLILIVSCTGNKNQGNSYDIKVRQEIVDEIEKMKPHFPIQIPNTPLTIDDVHVEGDLVIFEAAMPKSLWEDGMAFGSDVANSDKNVARMLTNVNQEQLEKFIKAGLGIRYGYKSLESGETFMTIAADCERLQRVKDGVASGEIVPYTALEIFQMEIDKYEFPCEIEDGIWMTDGYLSGTTVYYITNLDSDITSDDLSYSDIREMKQGILEGLKESLVSVHKKEMEQKGIRVICVYKNKDGDEFARIEISSDDL